MAEHDRHDCQSYLAHLSDFIDNNLEADLCRQIEEHMQGCRDCRIVVDTLRKTVLLYHEQSQRELELPAEVRRALMERLAPIVSGKGGQISGQGNGSGMTLLKVGDTCPACGLCQLDYNGMLELACSRCGFKQTDSGGCT